MACDGPVMTKNRAEHIYDETASQQTEASVRLPRDRSGVPKHATATKEQAEAKG